MKRTLLLAVTVAAALAGIVLFMRPGMEQAKKQAAQDALLQSVEDGGGAVALPTPAHHAAEMDVYRAQIGGVEEPAPSPPPETTTEQEAPAVEPPQEITGIGILTIERINLKMPVTEGATAAQLDVAAGWIPETAPIGETGNAVIAGHRSYTYGRQFNRLAELQPGDMIEYTPIGGESMTFTVTELLTIEPGDLAALEQPEDKRLLTLYTCTPIRTATHRLLVRAQRMD